MRTWLKTDFLDGIDGLLGAAMLVAAAWLVLSL
jgi:UDP-N-acetylmuramyl pentapeptide phosphotransferase/UDP-N-acetylglucosamine-1-phosphate transferase